MTLSTHFMAQRTKSSPFQSPRVSPLSNENISSNLLEFCPFYGGTPNSSSVSFSTVIAKQRTDLCPISRSSFINTFHLTVPCSAFEVLEVRFVISELFIADTSQVTQARVSDPLSGPIQYHKEAATLIEH
jgi:hypothetical protein